MPTVLVVDDDSEIRLLLSRLMRRDGFDVCEASGGNEALGRCTVSMPDLLITDVFMPDGTGIDLLRGLQAAGLSVPAIVMSGDSHFAGVDYFAIARGLGAAATLEKPFERWSVQLALAKALGPEA